MDSKILFLLIILIIVIILIIIILVYTTNLLSSLKQHLNAESERIYCFIGSSANSIKKTMNDGINKINMSNCDYMQQLRKMEQVEKQKIAYITSEQYSDSEQDNNENSNYFMSENKSDNKNVKENNKCPIKKSHEREIHIIDDIKNCYKPKYSTDNMPYFQCIPPYPSFFDNFNVVNSSNENIPSQVIEIIDEDDKNDNESNDVKKIINNKNDLNENNLDENNLDENNLDENNLDENNLDENNLDENNYINRLTNMKIRNDLFDTIQQCIIIDE